MSHRKMWVKLNYLVISGMPSCAVQWLQTKSSHILKEICQVKSIKFCSLKLQVSFKKQYEDFILLGNCPACDFTFNLCHSILAVEKMQSSSNHWRTCQVKQGRVDSQIFKKQQERCRIIIFINHLKISSELLIKYAGIKKVRRAVRAICLPCTPRPVKQNVFSKQKFGQLGRKNGDQPSTMGKCLGALQDS